VIIPRISQPMTRNIPSRKRPKVAKLRRKRRQKSLLTHRSSLRLKRRRKIKTKNRKNQLLHRLNKRKKRMKKLKTLRTQENLIKNRLRT
jgi:hypothetical protein